MARWETVAVVGPNYPDPDRLLETPYELAPGVFVGPLERWPVPDFVEASLSQHQMLDLRAAKIALAAEFEDTAIAERAEPSADTDRKREAERRLRLANLALWLARPSALSIWLVADVELTGERAWRGHRIYDRLIPVESYSRETLTAADLAFAKERLAGLEIVPRDGAPWIAATLLLKALREIDEALRLLLLWVATESLFGPEDAREITHRLAQRVGFFLGSTRSEARKIFNVVKGGYGWRSRIVHGMRVGKVKREESMQQVLAAENVVRRSLNRILVDGSLIETFSGKARESYLTDLPFRDV